MPLVKHQRFKPAVPIDLSISPAWRGDEGSVERNHSGSSSAETRDFLPLYFLDQSS